MPQSLESSVEPTKPPSRTPLNQPTTETNIFPTLTQPIVPDDATVYPARRPTGKLIPSNPPFSFEPLVPSTPYYPVAVPSMEVDSPTESTTVASPSSEPHGILTPEPSATVSPAVLTIQPSREPHRSPTPSQEVTYTSAETPPPRQSSTSGIIEPTITPTFELTGVPRQTPGTNSEPSESLESSVEPTNPPSRTPLNQPTTEPNIFPNLTQPIVPDDATVYPTRRPTGKLIPSNPPFAFEPLVPSTPYPVAVPSMEVDSPTESTTVASPSSEPHGILTPEPSATVSPAVLTIQPSREPHRSPTPSQEVTYTSAETPPPRQSSTSGIIEPTITPTFELTGVPRQTPGTSPEPSESLESSVEPTKPPSRTPLNQPITEPNIFPNLTQPIVPDDATVYPTRRPTGEPIPSNPPFAFEPLVPSTPYPVALPSMEVDSPTESTTVASPSSEPHGILTPEPSATASPAVLTIQPSHEPHRSPTPSQEVTSTSAETPLPRQSSTSGIIEPTITPTFELTGVPRQTPGTSPEPSESLESSVEPTKPPSRTPLNQPITEPNIFPNLTQPIVPDDATVYPTRRPTGEPIPSNPPFSFEPLVPTTPYPVAVPSMEVDSPTESTTVASPSSEPHGILTPEPSATVSPAVLTIQPSREPHRSPTPSQEVTYTSAETPPPRQSSTFGIIEPTITPTFELTGVPRQTPGTSPEPSEFAMPSEADIWIPGQINGSLMPGGSEIPSTLLVSSPQPGATPTTGASAIPPVIPSRHPTVASGSPESGENAAWTTLGSPTVQPAISISVVAPTTTGSPNRQPVATTTSSKSQGDMVPASSGYPSFQPWATPASRPPVVPPTTLNIPPRTTVTDSPVLAGNMTPTTPGGSSAQPMETPVPFQPAFASTHPNAVENLTFSPMIPTESPLMGPPGSMKPASSLTTHTPLGPPSSTSTPSWTMFSQTPTLTPTATPTTNDASAAVVELRIGVIGTVMFVATGGVAVSILGSIFLRERDVTSLAITAGTDIQTGYPINRDPRFTSYRKPSATLSTILVSQLQFIATLSLVDYVFEEEPWLRDFCIGLRWVNLWWPASFAEDSIISSKTARRALREGSVDDLGDISPMVSIGNLTLVVGLLLGIFLLHVLLISGLEALWLLKKRARCELKAARRCGITADELLLRMFAGARGRHYHLRGSFVTPEIDPETEEGHLANKSQGPQLQPTTRAPRKATAFKGSSIWDAKFFTGGVDNYQDHDAKTARSQRQRAADQIAECRDMSGSVWLYFPHVELLFLFFAFQGTVAAQVAALQNEESMPLTIVASAALVLYPLLLLVGVCRTIAIHLRSVEIVQFREFRPPIDTDRFALTSVADSSGGRGLFSQADRGRWYTASAKDDMLLRERNWFRIGFEPLFVDFAQSGVWFTMFSLAECTALACIGVLIDTSIVQLLLFCSIHTISFIAVVVCRPFANKVIDAMVAALAFTNAVCMVLMSVSTLAWTGTPRAARTNIAVATVQLIVLCALAFPAYLDLALAIMKTLNYRTAPTRKEVKADDAVAKIVVRRFTRRMWARTWCTLLGNNLSAFMKDVYAGVSRPQSRSQIWPQATESTISLAAQESSRRHGVNIAGIPGNPLNVGATVTVYPTPARVGGAARSVTPLIESNAGGRTTRHEVTQYTFDGGE